MVLSEVTVPPFTFMVLIKVLETTLDPLLPSVTGSTIRRKRSLSISLFQCLWSVEQAILTSIQIFLSHFIFDSLRYINDTFFPLDGIGWQDHCNGHNYAYCFQGSWSFGYQGGEVFSFTGDDDVWVYINGKFDFLVSSSDWKLRLFGH